MDRELEDSAETVEAEDARFTGETEPERVFRWRLERLAHAGYEYGPAFKIALRAHVDLHEAIDLVSSGCPPRTAARILL